MPTITARRTFHIVSPDFQVLGPVLSWAEGGLAFTVVEKAARIISESEGEWIGIACGTPFDNAGGVRIGIHESLIV